MALIGCKNNKDIYNNLLGKLIPNDIELYIEPFGGEFGLYEIMSPKPPLAVYSDINSELYNKVKDKYKNNISISCFNKDYKDVFFEFDSKYTFWYVDCPYYEKYYYEYNFNSDEEHRELAEILKKIKGRFLLSYQDRPFMRELYKDFNIYKYTGTSFILKPEIAITNYIL